MVTIELNTQTHKMHDITQNVKDIVKRMKIQEGICLVFTPHSTAAIAIACGIDPNALLDIEDFIQKTVPLTTKFNHICDPVTDAAGHIKSMLINADHTFPVSGGEIVLGGSQEIYFYEFDGPRKRQVHIQVIGV